MRTMHLGDRPHPVIASAAREILNNADNERSGVLSTALSFLGLYRDPIIAKITSRCAWRILDLVEGVHPVSLFLLVPPSDISRTKPLIRLMLNQIGRRLTESLKGESRTRKLLLMLDEFPTLGRLDFFEAELAFIAGYGIRAFLIAQSLNQIERAYGPNNAILDNCHVRVAFSTNDERTAKRISDALGTATELHAQRNYAGHRLSPWLGHLMVSRQETARQLLTPGEIMQLPPEEEIVMVSGHPPVRARKLRYFLDSNFTRRVLPPPSPEANASDRPPDDPTTRRLEHIARSRRAAPRPRFDPVYTAGRKRRRRPFLRAWVGKQPRAVRRRSGPRSHRYRQRMGRHVGDRLGRPTAPCGATRRPRPRRRAALVTHTRLNIYVHREHAKRLAVLAKMQNVSKSSLVATALTWFLSPEGGQAREATLVRRLDRLAQQFERLERDQTIQMEALALFIRHQLSVTAPIPEGHQQAARAQGRARFEQFIDQLARHLQRGGSLVRDVWQEIAPDAAGEGAGPSNGGNDSPPAERPS